MLNDPHTNRHTDEAVAKQRNGGGGEGKGLRGWRAASPDFLKMVDDAATEGCLVCHYFGM